jgi:hypothetical protein
VGGVVSTRRFAGAQTFYHVTLANGELVVVGNARSAKIGDTVHVRLAEPMRAYAFPSEEP